MENKEKEEEVQEMEAMTVLMALALLAALAGLVLGAVAVAQFHLQPNPFLQLPRQW